MYFKTKLSIIGLALLMLATFSELQAQCYPNQIVTASFATGGSSPYKNDVLWLTWGSDNQTTHPHGKPNVTIRVGTKSYASIALGNNQWLCIEAEVIKITGGTIRSYAPGNYNGDYLDDLYNIGGIGKNNKLVSGIITGDNNQRIDISIKAKATIDGVPIRLAGMVVADAESLANTEYIHATADGNWTLVEVKKNLTQGAYDVRKERVNVGGVPTSRRAMKFLKGNDNETMAVSFLKFNESAYKNTGTNPDLSITIDATIRGNGLTALALGLLPPEIDGGDAPKTYGYPMHLLQRLNFSSDGIEPVNDGSTAVTNINTSTYSTGAIIPNTQLSRLGSTPPDTERIPLYSSDAMGDNNNGTAGQAEEDAWPIELQSFSQKVYLEKINIEAAIQYSSRTDGYIAGWIDFDLNGTFDANEKVEVFAPSTDGANGSVLLNWSVPPSRVGYSTFVRLRLSETPNMTPTQTVNTGEVEDHKIKVLVPGVTNPMLLNRGKFRN